MSKEQLYIRPPDDINPKKKEKADYILEWAKYIHNDYQENGIYAWRGYGDADIMLENRLYGAGRQSNTKYMKSMGVNSKDGNLTSRALNFNTREEETKNYFNLNFESMSPAPKFIYLVVNKYMQNDHSVDFHDLTKEVYDKKLAEKYKMLMKIDDPELAQILELSQGIQPQQQEQINGQFAPQNREELEAFDKMGGFKTTAEMMHKRASIANFDQSDWTPEIKRKILTDYATMGVMGVKDYLDRQTGQVKTRYVDPLEAGFSYTRRANSKQSPYAFEYVYYTIAELRTELDISEDELRQVASMSQDGTRAGLNYYDDFQGSFQDQALGLASYAYDDVRIRVMDFEFITTNTSTKTIRKKDDGTVKVYDESKDKEYKNSKQREVVKDKYNMIYRGKWIPDTEHIFDYGAQYDIPRENEKEANLSFHFHVLDGPSVIDQIKGYVDDMILVSLKMQNALAKARPSGLAIEWNSISNMDLDGRSAKPLEIMRLTRQTGDLVFKATTHRGVSPRMGGAGMPFQELQGGPGRDFDKYMQYWNFSLTKIQQVTGINDIVDGSSPNPEVTKGQAVLAAEASNNALDTIYQAYKWIKKEVAMNMALRTQIAIQYGKGSYDFYSAVIGTNAVEILSLNKKHLLSKIGISLRLRASRILKDQFNQIAQESIRAGSITFTDYLLLQPYVDDGRIEEATAILAYRERQRKQDEEKAQQAAIAQQGEQQQAIVQQKSQADQQMVQIDIQKAQALSEIKVKEFAQMEQIKYEYQSRLEDDKSDNKIEENAVASREENTGADRGEK